MQYVVIYLGECFGPFEDLMAAQTFANTKGGKVTAIKNPTKDSREISSIYEHTNFYDRFGELYYLIYAMDGKLILIKDGCRLRWDRKVWLATTTVQEILDYYNFSSKEELTHLDKHP